MSITRRSCSAPRGSRSSSYADLGEPVRRQLLRRGFLGASSAASGVPAFTSAMAIGEAMQALGAKRVALVSPYSAEVNASARRYYESKYGL